MSRLLFTVSLALGLAGAGAALAAQTTSSTCGNTRAKAAQSTSATPSTTSMADTSSDMGNAGSGASSDSIGTGPIDKTGVNSPCAPGATGQSATGALPSTP